MRKRIFVGIIAMSLCFVFFSCDIDPYVGRRPLEYRGSVWKFQNEKYVIYYYPDEIFQEQITDSGQIITFDQSYYQKAGGEKQRISFLWSELDNRVSTFGYKENSEKVPLFSGRCKFHKKWFSITVTYDYSDENYFPETLYFERIL